MLGEDDRLVTVPASAGGRSWGVSGSTTQLGVLVVAIGSSNPAANARTAPGRAKLVAGTQLGVV